MKKLISIFLIMAAFMAGTMQASAVDKETATIGIISPQFTGISLLSANLSITTGGCATCTGKIVPSSSSYTSHLTVSLQKNTSGSWITIKSWSSSNTGLSGVNLSGSYYIARGTYRSCSSASIYNSSGALVDSATAYSTEKTY